MKHNNIHIIGIPEGDEGAQGIKNIFEELWTENLPNLVKEKDTQVWEVQKIPNYRNLKRPTPRHIIIKMAKDKYKVLKSGRERQLSAKMFPLNVS